MTIPMGLQDDEGGRMIRDEEGVADARDVRRPQIAIGMLLPHFHTPIACPMSEGGIEPSASMAS